METTTLDIEQSKISLSGSETVTEHSEVALGLCETDIDDGEDFDGGYITEGQICKDDKCNNA